MSVEMLTGAGPVASGPIVFCCAALNGPRRREGGDGGFAALSLMLGLAVVVLPVLVVVLSLPVWLERAAAAQDAARLAARQLASNGSWARGSSCAQTVVGELAQAEGWGPGTYFLAMSGSVVPGGTVVASVYVAMPLAALPGLGELGDVTYRAVSVDHVDSYRSGT